MAASMNKFVITHRPSLLFLRIFTTTDSSITLHKGPFSYSRCVFFSRKFTESQKDANEVSLPNELTGDCKLDESIANSLEKKKISTKSEHIRYRGHAGVMRLSKTQLPARLVKALTVMAEKYPVDQVTESANKLTEYLRWREPPASGAEINRRAKEIDRKIMEKNPNKFEGMEGGELELAMEKHRKAVIARLRRTLYHWKPLTFDAYTAYVYLVARMTFDYSVTLQCLTEISKRDPEFQPTSIYHYGSRIGATIWAGDKIWSNKIGEHYCVDNSSYMNTLARFLLQDCNEQAQTMSINGVHFRQFDLSPKENKFPLVICPFMLMEQSSNNEVYNLLLNLWEMTGTYLVLIEAGNEGGFSLINDAREFILNVSAQADSNEKRVDLKGHVFAPCPHDKPCPKATKTGGICTSLCNHKDIDMKSGKIINKPKTDVKYSYVILKKGERDQSESQWPRVLHQSKSKRRSNLNLCSPSGDLQYVIVSKSKFDPHVYGASRYVTTGDLLPVTLSTEVSEGSSDYTEDVEEDVVDSCQDLEKEGNNL